MNRMRLTAVATTAVAGLAVLTACGGGSNSGSPAASGTPAPSSGQSGGQSAGTAVALRVAQVGNLGQVVVAADGKTVYRFDKDTANPPKSNCTGACATAWPPVTVPGGTPSAQGVDPSLLGTVTRADGSKQVTLAGWPLYEYAEDTAAGQASGQGDDNTWWALTPDGKKAVAQAASAPSSSGGGGGYGNY